MADLFTRKLLEELKKPIYKYALGLAFILLIIALSLKFGYRLGEWLYALLH